MPAAGNHGGGDASQFRSKTIISLVAKRWQDVPPNQKQEWKRRAKQMSEQEQLEETALQDDGDGEDEGESEDEDDEEEETTEHEHHPHDEHAHVHHAQHPHPHEEDLVHNASPHDAVGSPLATDHGGVRVDVAHEQEHEHEHEHANHEIGDGHEDTHGHEHAGGHGDLQGGVGVVAPEQVGMVHHHHEHDEVVGDEAYAVENPMQI